MPVDFLVFTSMTSLSLLKYFHYDFCTVTAPFFPELVFHHIFKLADSVTQISHTDFKNRRCESSISRGGRPCFALFGVSKRTLFLAQLCTFASTNWNVAVYNLMCGSCRCMSRPYLYMYVSLLPEWLLRQVYQVCPTQMIKQYLNCRAPGHRHPGLDFTTCSDTLYLQQADRLASSITD